MLAICINELKAIQIPLCKVTRIRGKHKAPAHSPH